MPIGTKPSVTVVGVTTKEVPVQIVRLIGLIAGAGFTNTVKVNIEPALAPVHAPIEGIISYTAVWVTLVALFKLPVMFVVPVSV